MYAGTPGADCALEPQQDAHLKTTGLQRLAGGLSNLVFRYRLHEQSYVLKLYHPNERDSDGREWGALRLFERYLADGAPRPVLHDRNGDDRRSSWAGSPANRWAVGT
jgi:Ser/Thr protein kinase RdoA (MazF antagonist)